MGLFYLDIYTDINATIAVAETGQHPWWTGRMITFLLLPLVLTWIGVTLYVRQVVTGEVERFKYLICLNRQTAAVDVTLLVSAL